MPDDFSSIIPGFGDKPIAPPRLSELGDVGIGAAASQAFGASFDSMFNDFTSVTANALETFGAFGEDKMDVDEANRLGSDYGLNFDKTVSAAYLGTLMMQKQEQRERDYWTSRAPEGVGSAAIMAGANLAGMAVNPVNVATSFIPIVGQARYAAMAARMGTIGARATTGAIEGLIGTALMEPLTAAGATIRDDEYTLQNTMANLTFGTILGGGLHLAVGLGGDIHRGGGVTMADIRKGQRIEMLGNQLEQAANDFQPGKRAPDVGAATKGNGETPPLPDPTQERLVTPEPAAAPAPLGLAEAVETLPFDQRADLTTDAIAQVGASRAVDMGLPLTRAISNDGMPLVLYHGTNQAFESFSSTKLGANTKTESSGMGFWFSESPVEAGDYAGLAAKNQISNAEYHQYKVDELNKKIESAQKLRNFDEEERLTQELEDLDIGAVRSESGQVVYPVYLDIKNPKIIDATGKSLNEIGPQIKEAKAQGYDGVKIENIRDPARSDVERPATNQWVAFSSEQIKSKFEKPVKLPDTVNDDITARQSDIDFIETMASTAEREAEAILADDMERLKGIELTEEEKTSLAEADEMMNQVKNVEAAIRAGANCLLKG